MKRSTSKTLGFGEQPVSAGRIESQTLSGNSSTGEHNSRKAMPIGMSPAFAPFAKRMADEGLPQIFIDKFAYYHAKLLAGDDGLIPERELAPVASLPDAERLPDDSYTIGREASKHTVIIKLNGGLGTGMGLTSPKSALVVKDGLTFLDIIARQAISNGAPLLLMNSFATEAESLNTLARYRELQFGLPLSFLQHKQPKIMVENLGPARWESDPDLEWCPPGHGDLYTALETSGTLAQLLDAGIEYAFVSNADNLGAVLDMKILAYMVVNKLPFLMEVADRTAADRKGGHLARSRNGQLLLREIAQCPQEDLPAFQDIGRHKYFNTNNLWLHLPALDRLLRERDHRLGLPMIRNLKTIDPRDPQSPQVYQLETAMGSAISVFEGAQAIRVPRTRFAPVKKTDDLLALRSDAYVLSPDYRVVLAPERNGNPPAIELIGDYYRFVTDFERHFPAGAPSLIHCNHLKVEGEFEFGRNVTARGDAHFHNPTGDCRVVPDDLLVEDSVWPV